MEELRDLQKMANNASERFEEYRGKDFILPEAFKSRVRTINSYTIAYNKYSAVVQTSGNQHGVQNIYMPNQWFYIASYFTDLYLELLKYKEYALQVTSLVRLKELNGKNLTTEETKAIEKLEINEESKKFIVKFITNYSWWRGAKTIDRGDFHVSPILACAKLVNASQSFIVDLCAFLADKQDLVQMIINEETSDKQKESQTSKDDSLQQITSSQYRPFVAAIKTKPFLLLAGISGTGKSRIVREMARACWPEENPNSKAQEPDNFMMIPVRPNWHDSTELVGYYSGIRERYMPGLFLKAVVKAWEMTTEFSEDGKTMPYFVCLDEMNLAPVEQYFAEYLSVIESRECKEGIYKSDALIRKTDEGFSDLCDELTVCRECQDGAAGGDVMTEEEPQFGKELTHKNKVEKLRSKFSEHGICLPPNLIVCGTVNMDETTFSFSRKVLDRAMTIEMNEVVLKAGLGEAKEQFPPIKSPESLLSLRITPEDYYDAEGKKETIDEVLEWLGKINEKLEGTPFKIAYRTRNEILLYVIHSEELGVGRKRAFDEAVNMKILPRIEGDQKKVGNVLAELTQVLKDEVGIAKEDGSPSMAKLEVMEDRLKKQYYCTYWN